MRQYGPLLALLAWVGLCAFGISGGGGGSGGLFINPEDISPPSGGTIWYWNVNLGSDARDCRSPSAACATFEHIFSLASAGDIIMMAAIRSGPCYSLTNFTIDKAVTVVGDPANLTNSCLYPGNPANYIMFVSFLGTGSSFYNISWDTDFNPQPVLHVGSATVNMINNLLWGGIYSNGGSLLIDDSRLQSVHCNGCNPRIQHSIIGPFFNTSPYLASPDVDLLDSGGGFAYSWVVNDNTFVDSWSPGHKFVDIPGANGAISIVANNRFPADLVHRSQLIMAASMPTGDNLPTGVVGSTASGQSQRETITSSNIKTGEQFLFTADGALDVDDIVLQTGATGLAGGTNLVVTSDNVTGPSTICSVPIVANLGANKAVSCVATGSMVPFQLEDGKSLKISCSGSDCTGGGTVTVIPKMRRAQEYSAVYAIPVPSPTPTPTATPT